MTRGREPPYKKKSVHPCWRRNTRKKAFSENQVKIIAYRHYITKLS